jgi:hypothetical protein
MSTSLNHQDGGTCPMPSSPLAAAVDTFARAACRLADATLEQDYVWRGQATDLRWCLFAVYSELGDLAATLAVERATHGPAPTVAQRAMADALGAVRDLQGLLLSAADIDIDRPPAAGEWSLREVLRHMLRGVSGFAAVLRWTVERIRNGEAPAQMPDDRYPTQHSDLDNSSDLGAVFGRLVAQHDAAVAEFAGLSEAELDAPFVWWFEAEVRFQLFRFDAHLREHTIQIAKLLESLAPPPTDALRTLRLVYGALAEVEGWQIGAPALAPAAVDAASARINAIAESLTALS